MNNDLTRLIADYQSRVQDAVALMYRSGIDMPFSSADWIDADIPWRGELQEGAHYFKHGAGCEVIFNPGEVDFDFGEQGEIGGLDLWRLIRFAGKKLADYGFENEESVKQCFDDAVNSGELVYSGYCLYYVADAPRRLAIDIDSRLPGDLLPTRDHDPVFLLHTHYFLTTELMRKNYENLRKKWDDDGRLSQKNMVNIRIYLFSWLGFLGVTCEGFRNLGVHPLLERDRPKDFQELLPKSGEIGRMMKKHSDSLREFRNNVFHLRKSPDAVREFFGKDAGRLLWASELHSEIAEFFSEYRILCEVHYALHSRKGEMHVIRKPRRHNKKL